MWLRWLLSTMMKIQNAICSTSQKKPSTIPAMAMPLPFCRPMDRLIWDRATKPKVMDRTEPPRIPKTNAAMAKPLVDCTTPAIGGGPDG